MLRHPEFQYLDLLAELLAKSSTRETRNDDASVSVFGRQMRFDLQQGFPLLTTKRTHFKSIVVELLWFLQGNTNIAWLNDHGVTIWDEWANERGDLGPVYGAQWRDWNGVGIDQIEALVKGLKENPTGRRHIVTAWNPEEIPDMALPPCHCFFQCYIDDDGRLSLQVYQRSADIFLGVPFNIASYALLTHLLALEVGVEVGELVWTAGDVHLYSNHREQAAEQLTRIPYPLPELEVVPSTYLEGYEPDDIQVAKYVSHPAIKADVSA